MFTGIIITHGTMAQCLVRTLGKITGAGFDLIPISNEGLDPDSIVELVEKAVSPATDGPLFVFSEFIGGSTWFAANKFANKHKNTYVLSGVNLPMLISFITKQDHMAAEDLANVLIEDANRGISLKYFGQE